MCSERFTSGQAAQLSGLPFSIINFWRTTGLLVPSIAHGNVRECAVYSFADVVALRVLAKMRTLSVARHVLAKAARCALGVEEGQVATYLVVPSDSEAFVCDDGVLEKVAPRLRLFWLFGFAECVDEVRRGVESLKPHKRGRAKAAVERS